MGGAALISLAEVRQHRHWQQVRQRLHAELEQGVDGREERRKRAAPPCRR